MQHADRAAADGGGVPAGLDAVAAGLQADQPHLRVVQEGVEDAHRVGPAADAGGDRVGQPAGAVQHLGAGLQADDPLEVADDHRERVRPGHRAEQVERVVDGGHPVPERLVDGVLEGGGAGLDGDHLGAQQPHPGDVQRLPLRVDPAHVDAAVQAEQRRGGGGGHPVLTGTGLGDQPGLAHPLGQQRLPQHVVDLVAAGVVEVLALEQDARAADLGGQPRGVGQRARPAGVVGRQVVQPGQEVRVAAGLAVVVGDLVQRADQRLGQPAATHRAEVAAVVGIVVGAGQPVEDGRGRRSIGRWRGHTHGFVAPERSTGTAARRAAQRAGRGQDGCEPAVTRSASAARGSPLVTSPSPTSTASAPAPA